MKIITANRLSDGAVVYLAAEGWLTEITHAAVLNAHDAIEAGLAAAARAVANREIVDTAAIDVTVEDKGPVPVRLRERIRAFGPTIAFGETARAALAA
ncbi:MAG: DUF2849 domain-containing protein [Salaquimonas sp.]|jgi:hypothetical protein|nr:DUF2849 domain-containing protein [Salaquimonas sp.]